MVNFIHICPVIHHCDVMILYLVPRHCAVNYTHVSYESLFILLSSYSQSVYQVFLSDSV